MKNVTIVLAFLLLSLNVVGQLNQDEQKFCKIMCLSGEVKLGGLYKFQQIERPNYSLKDTSYLLTGSVLLNAKTYIWHPNFLVIDAGVEYSPEKSRGDYYNGSINPNLDETRTLQKFDLRTILFQKKFISITNFFNTSVNYNNRDSLSSIRTYIKNYGGSFYIRNNYVPVSFNLQQGEVKQEELDTTYLHTKSRVYHYLYSNLDGRAQTHFGKSDKHELIVSHNEFKRVEREFKALTNKLDEIILNNEIFFDKWHKYRFYSVLNHGDQTGYDSLVRMQAYETVSFKLPSHFELVGNYNYYDIHRTVQDINQQTYRGLIRHKLYQSLFTSAYYEFSDARQTDFKQLDTRKGLDISYEKKIPKGVLNLSYSLLLQNEEKTGGTTLHIYREPYTLITGHLQYLNLPNIETNTIVVTDSSGNLIYETGFDYLLIPHGKFLEIVRVPGGQISDGTVVYVSYTANIPGSYQFDLTSQTWAGSVSLFKRFIGLSYRKTRQDYYNVDQSEEGLTLNFIDQQVYGCRLEYKAFIGGFEYDDNSKSSILPYQLKRYYLNIQAQLHQKLMFTLNGNYSDYHLVKDDINQQFTDVSGQLAYNITAKSKVNFDLGYRKQQGQKIDIDLDLFTARAEISTLYRQTSFTFGLQTFQRNYMEEIDNYNGAYFRISRRF